MERYFSYSDHAGFELHSTLAEAKLAAEESFNYCAADEFESVCYGELVGVVVDSDADGYELMDIRIDGSKNDSYCY